MNIIVYKIILLIVLVVIINNIFNKTEHLTINTDDDVYINVDMNRFDRNYPYYSYFGPLNDYFNGYGCNTPYCRNTWYNKYTPFVWNNPSRYPYYYSPLYTNILGDNYYY